MATFTKIKLSASTQGRGIRITTTSTPGTTIHATDISSSTIDEVWLYVTNVSTFPVFLTVAHGGTTNPDDLITCNIPNQSGLTLIVPGLILSGTGSTAATVTAWAASANQLSIHGYVNRIS
jgi:hypothetical protein